MLTGTDERTAGLTAGALQSGRNATKKAAAREKIASDAGRSPLSKLRRLEWVGQTVASVCWICSVLAYGIRSSGDLLQLCAASAWLLANIAAAATSDAASTSSADDAN